MYDLGFELDDPGFEDQSLGRVSRVLGSTGVEWESMQFLRFPPVLKEDPTLSRFLSVQLVHWRLEWGCFSPERLVEEQKT